MRAGIIYSLIAAGAMTTAANATSFSLDDNPSAPIAAIPGVIPGLGAEDPFGLGPFPGLAPSPSLAPFAGITGGDGAIFSPGPVVQHPGPNGFYVDSLSTNKTDLGLPIKMLFSVDRLGAGVAGSGLAAEAAGVQQGADIYESTASFASPGSLVGTLGIGPFAGLLPTAGVGGSNVLIADDSTFGLLAGGAIVPPGVPSASALGFATHDNIDGFDTGVFDAGGDGLFDVDGYFTIYPDEAFAVGASPADIFAVAAGDGGAIPVPYAPGVLLGLDPAVDSIDALSMFDGGSIRPVPLGLGPSSMIEPGIDYALFSLAPGSFSLSFYGIGPGDILFTDFTGVFGIYATEADMGIIGAPGGPIGGPSNIDALDFRPGVTDGGTDGPGREIPEPITASLALIGIGTLGMTLRRRDR